MTDRESFTEFFEEVKKTEVTWTSFFRNELIPYPLSKHVLELDEESFKEVLPQVNEFLDSTIQKVIDEKHKAEKIHDEIIKWKESYRLACLAFYVMMCQKFEIELANIKYTINKRI